MSVLFLLKFIEILQQIFHFHQITLLSLKKKFTPENNFLFLLMTNLNRLCDNLIVTKTTVNCSISITFLMTNSTKKMVGFYGAVIFTHFTLNLLCHSLIPNANQFVHFLATQIIDFNKLCVAKWQLKCFLFFPIHKLIGFYVCRNI